MTRRKLSFASMFHLRLPTLYPVAVCRCYLSPTGGMRGGGEQMGAGGGVIGVARLTERVRVVLGCRRDTDNTAIRLSETDPWISAAWYKRPRRRGRRRQVGQQGDWLSAPGWRELICLSCRSSWGSCRKTCLTVLRTRSVCYLETKRKIFVWCTLKCTRWTKTKESLSSRFMFGSSLRRAQGWALSALLLFISRQRHSWGLRFKRLWLLPTTAAAATTTFASSLPPFFSLCLSSSPSRKD